MTTPSPRRRKVDANSLQGLAHPLRVQICDCLAMYGPATATQLGARLGESSGATSYHLRQLEKYGFVEEDPSRGSGRERWWRRVPGGISIDSHELVKSPSTRDATNLVVNEFHRAKRARLDHWRATYEQWPMAWQTAAWEMSMHLRLTPAELDELNRKIGEIVDEVANRTRDREGDGVLDVELQMSSFPVGDPPPGSPGEDAGQWPSR